MAQRVQNVNTGEVRDVENFGTGAGSTGQTMSDVAGFVPVAGSTPLAEASLNSNVAGDVTNGGNMGTGKDNFDRAGELLSDIQTPMGLADIRKREEEQKAGVRAAAASIFDPLTRRAAELGADRLGSGKGQLGVSRGLGLSTAGLSYLNSIERETADRLGEIQKSRAEFIRSGNSNAIERADAAIAKLEEAQNNILFKKIDLGLKFNEEDRAEKQLGFDERRVVLSEEAGDLAQEKFGFDKEAFAVSEERLNRTAALAEERFDREVSTEEKEEALNNIARLATSGVSLSDEQKTILEADAGLLPGTFEAIYSRAQQDAARGDQIDSLKIKKMQADIANVYSSINKRNTPTPDENGLFPGLNKEQSKNMVAIIPGIRAAGSREAAIANLKEDTLSNMLTVGPAGIALLEQQINEVYGEPEEGTQFDDIPAASDITTDTGISRLDINSSYEEFKGLNPRKDFTDFMEWKKTLGFSGTGSIGGSPIDPSVPQIGTGGSGGSLDGLKFPQ